MKIKIIKQYVFNPNSVSKNISKLHLIMKKNGSNKMTWNGNRKIEDIKCIDKPKYLQVQEKNWCKKDPLGQVGVGSGPFRLGNTVAVSVFWGILSVSFLGFL